MPMLTPGRYKAKVTSVSLKRKGPNDLLVASMFFEAYEYKNDAGEYDVIDQPGWGLICDKYLQKKDKSVADGTFKQLCEVFDWSGDLTELPALVGQCAKITVINDEFKGKTTPKVDWINHIDSGDHDGGFTLDFDLAFAKAAQAQLGAKVRAALGSTAQRPATANVAPTARPAGPPVAPSNSALAQQLAANSNATAESVWAQFEARMAETGVPAEHVNSAWFDLLQETVKTQDAALVQDWAKVAVAVPTYEYLPFN